MQPVSQLAQAEELHLEAGDKWGQSPRGTEKPLPGWAGGRQGEELGWAGAGKGELGCREGVGQLARTTAPPGPTLLHMRRDTGAP